MTEVTRAFYQNNYVLLKDFLDKDNCDELVFELKRLVNEGKSTKDDQCPLSESIHGGEVFDSLLEQLTPYFEEASGLSLYPTYAYARLYAPGDELKIHTDRPACEISATLTLGFEGDPWPIFVADYAENSKGRKVVTQNNETKWITNERKFEMTPGDAILYRGMDKVHWREQYKEGKWQAQVFLHYVDANGPHADERYDKRPSLSHHKTESLPEFTYWYFKDAIPKYACDKLIQSYEQANDEVAAVGVGDQGTVDKSIRDVNKVILETYKGIGATLAGMGVEANHQAWQFDITRANQVEYLKYDANGHYLPHVDTFLVKGQDECRKITVLAFLNDDFEGGRLFLQTGHEKLYPPQSAGTVIVFPSFVLHGVEPVTSGFRRTIVTWMVGPWFK